MRIEKIGFEKEAHESEDSCGDLMLHKWATGGSVVLDQGGANDYVYGNLFRIQHLRMMIMILILHQLPIIYVHIF